MRMCTVVYLRVWECVECAPLCTSGLGRLCMINASNPATESHVAQGGPHLCTTRFTVGRC